MKKLLTTHGVRLLLAFLCIVGGFANAKADVTIWVYGTASPYVHTWTSGATTQQLTNSVEKDGKTWYYATFSGVNSMDFEFATSAGGWKTPDLNATSGDNYYYFDSNSSYGLNLTSIKGKTSYVMYETSDWSNCNIYTYGSESHGSWSGTAMTNIGGVKDGKKVFVWSGTNTISSSNVIFNNGSSQTVNLTWNNKYYYYASGTDNGKVTCGTSTDYSSISFPTASDIVVTHTYTVAGQPTSVFGGSSTFDATLTANDMMLSSGVYTWTKSDFLFPSTSLQYKVYEDHATTTSYPSSNKTVSGTAGKVSTLTVTYNPDDNSVSHTLTEATFTVAGNNDDSGAFGSNWSASDTDNDMTYDSSTGKYTWTSGDFVHNGTNPKFKVCKDHAWATAYPSSDYEVTGGSSDYTYNITVTYDPSDNSVSAVLNQVSAPVVPIFLHYWGSSSSMAAGSVVEMTSSDDNLYTYTLDLNKGDYVLFTDNASKTWNAGTQYAQSSGNHTFTANDSGTAVSGTSNVYQTNTSTGAGNWTFTFNKTSMAWTAVQNSVSYDPLYLRHWTGSQITDGSAATGTTTDNVNYTFSNVSLAQGEYVVFSTANSGAWNNGTQYNCSESSDKTFASGTAETASTSGNSAYVTPIAGTWNFTFNTSTGAWTPTLVSASAQTWYLKGDLTDWDADQAGSSQMSTSDNITYTMSITISTRTTTTKNICLLSSLGSGSNSGWDDANANYRYYSNDGTVYPAPAGVTCNIVKGGNNNNIVLAKGLLGTYTFSFNTSTRVLTVTGPAVVDVQDWYLLSQFDGNTWKLNNTDDKFTYDENTGNYTLTKTISLTGGATNFLLSKGGVANSADGWNDISSTRYNPASDTEVNDNNLGTALSFGQNSSGSWYFPAGYAGTYTFTINGAGTTLTVTGPAKQSRETGEMYIIGRANGGVFQADLGTKMTKLSDGIYQADNVQLMSGADFSFTGKLGSNAEDWTTANYYRWYNTAGYCIEVQDSQVGSVADNTTGTEFALQDTGDGSTGTSNFSLKTSGAYRITVNTNTKKVRFEKMYASLYMFGKGFTWGNTTPNEWDPTSAIAMTTTDGNIYHLDAVQFTNDSDVGFMFSSVVANDNNDGGMQYVAKNGFFPSNSDNYLIRRNDEQIDINKGLTMVAGSTDDTEALANFKGSGNGGDRHVWYVHGTEVAETGKYNVVVNIAEMTVTLKENISISNELTIRLEQTDNLKGKRPAVKVWIEGGTITKFKGVWADGAEGSHMEGSSSGTGSGNVTSQDETYWLDGSTWFKCREYTSFDNRKWWEWEIGGTSFRIGSIDFYRNDDETDKPADPNGELSRRSGVLYYTWVESDNIEDNTTDYYIDHVKEAPECATMLDGHLYVYFVNTPGWSTVYCYAWDENNQGIKFDPNTSKPVSASWPGDVCQVVGYNEDGFAVYRYDFGLESIWESEGKTIAGVIFNNGSNDEQTGDFPFKNGGVFDYVGRVSLGRSLANIIAKGVVNGPKYVVEDDLVIVYYNPYESGTYTVPIYEDGVQTGTTTTNYTGVYYAKDLNNYTDKSLNTSGKTDYVFDVTQFTAGASYYDANGVKQPAGTKVQLLMKNRGRYDQSNWVRLVKANTYENVDGNIGWTKANLVGKKVSGDNLGGQLVDNYNPTMIIEELPSDALTAQTYTYNDFIAPHFNDDYSVNDNGELFFVQPKPNEVAHVTWVVYGGHDSDGYKFYTPAGHAELNNVNVSEDENQMFHVANNYDLKGGLLVKDWNWVAPQDGYSGTQEAFIAELISGLIIGQAYEFDAIIEYNEQPVNPAGRRLKTEVEVQNGVNYDNDMDFRSTVFDVRPVSANISGGEWVVTKIDDIKTDVATREVKAVRIYNIMGVQQTEMQPGVNIIETIYTDGSRTTTKVLR